MSINRCQNLPTQQNKHGPKKRKKKGKRKLAKCSSSLKNFLMTGKGKVGKRQQREKSVTMFSSQCAQVYEPPNPNLTYLSRGLTLEACKALLAFKGARNLHQWRERRQRAYGPMKTIITNENHKVLSLHNFIRDRHLRMIDGIAHTHMRGLE